MKLFVCLPVSWYSRHTLTSPHTVPTCSLPAAHTLDYKMGLVNRRKISKMTY